MSDNLPPVLNPRQVLALDPGSSKQREGFLQRCLHIGAGYGVVSGSEAARLAIPFKIRKAVVGALVQEQGKEGGYAS
ncbi:MAG: hypothetical protein A2Z14_10060 [Chloroflexi bacterium RBG_16_48_8]|nr:MAG: hypothetical protein A2Z14_10060 [Chloroflexi bacterium RBG_16_48_8]